MRISSRFRMVFALLCMATLSGCPFGDKAPPGPTQADASAAAQGLHIVLSGSGVTPQGAAAYAYALGNTGNAANELSLKILHEGRAVTAQSLVASSDSNVIAIKRPDQLRVLATGSVVIKAAFADAGTSISIRVVDPTVAATDVDVPETFRYRVTRMVLWNADGPIKAVYTDNMRCASTSVADIPMVWATIVDQRGREVGGEQCEQFRGLVTPRISVSGWPGDSRGARGLVEYYESYAAAEFTTSKSPGGCGFSINARGMPIIGSGLKPFKLHIHGTCEVIDTLDGCGQPGFPCEPMLIPRVCGAPLPGGTLPFGVVMQSMDERTYC